MLVYQPILRWLFARIPSSTSRRNLSRRYVILWWMFYWQEKKWTNNFIKLLLQKRTMSKIALVNTKPSFQVPEPKSKTSWTNKRLHSQKRSMMSTRFMLTLSSSTLPTVTRQTLQNTTKRLQLTSSNSRVSRTVLSKPSKPVSPLLLPESRSSTIKSLLGMLKHEEKN